MKKIILLSIHALLLSPLVSAQIICIGSGPATTVAFPMAGRISFDDYGDPNNETGTLNAAITGDVVGVEVAGLNLATVGNSWCNEATIDLINPNNLGGITYTPSGDNGGSPCDDMPATGFFDLAVLGLVFPTGASGAIDWELSENFDDNNNAADANWTAGTITLYVCPTGQVLPVELLSFEGKVTAHSNMIYWTVAGEQNLQWYTIERSANGVSNWTAIGKIAAQRTLSTEQGYTYDDRNPLPRAYYRLRIVDMDGHPQFSKNITLARNDQPFGITAVIPSPTTGATIVGYATEHEESVTLRVTDMTGRLVLEQDFEAAEGINNIPVDLKSLQTGIYLIVVNNGKDITAPVRVVKQ